MAATGAVGASLVAGRAGAESADNKPAKLPAAQSTTAQTPGSYFADEKEWGQLRWLLKLAEQAPSDFSNYKLIDEAVGPAGCHYTIAFSTYFLALEQHRKFPAWQGPIQQAMDAMNQKMLQKQAWKYWSEITRGVRKNEPNLDQPYPFNLDPIAPHNIMYSGHVGMMINLYQSLYRDQKWDAAGAIKLVGDGAEQFVYDNRSLQDTMFLQAINNRVPGIDCEPNAIYPACNTHSMLSFKLYDQLHGSRYFDSLAPAYDRFLRDTMINWSTKEVAPFYLIKQGFPLAQWNPRLGNKLDPIIAYLVRNGASINSPANEGWTGMFTHGFNKPVFEELYPYLKQRYVRRGEDGSIYLTVESDVPDLEIAFFAGLAGELGDEEVRKGLLNFADKTYSPVWQDGTYHYPFNDDVAYPQLHKDHNHLAIDIGGKATDLDTILAYVEAHANDPKPPPQVQNITTVMHHLSSKHSDVTDRLLAIARAITPDGIHALANKPFDEEHFREPKITNVDVTKLALRRAAYDRNSRSLDVATFAGKDSGASVAFDVVNLDPKQTYMLVIDGQETARFGNTATQRVELHSAKPHEIALIASEGRGL
jgi:hypothetical protein